MYQQTAIRVSVSPKKRKAKPVESGSRNLQPRRTFRCSKEEFAAQDAAAKRGSVTWTEWMRDAARAAQRKSP